MNGLYRDLAPITSDAWAEIDKEALRTLKSYLAARKLVDFTGPLGWTTSAINLGRMQALSGGPVQHVEARLRQVQPLVEVRVPFELSRAELDTIERGSTSADLQPLIDAARSAALAEDHAVFNGYPEAGIQGIGETAAGSALTVTTDYHKYPTVVAEAIETLQTRGIDGPYAIALGPRCFTGLRRTFTSGGYPVVEHVRGLLDGPIVWAPAIDGAV
ncbi:MAG: bacteriocin family protein, partial [Nitrococcus sp.]|nr:bacteriocin family protein [Nitrococcus sp.]